MALSNTVKESSHLKDISQFCKLFVLIFIIFILLQKSEKRVTGINKRLNLWSLFIDWGNQFLIIADWIIENDLHHILCMVLESFVKWRRLGLFFGACLAQTGYNNCKLSKVSKREQIGSILTYPKLEKWISIFNYSKIAK